MEKFPSSAASGDRKIDSGPYRENKTAIEYHRAGTLERFLDDPKEALEGMFGSDLKLESLSSDELADVQNYIDHVSKRLAAGAVSAKVFHEQVVRGNVQKALNTFNPGWALGHDSIHAMFSYLESDGASLVPAYMKVDGILDSRGASPDNQSNLEEQYVAAFTGPKVFLGPIFKELADEGLSGEELVQALIDRWDVEVAQKVSSSGVWVRDPNYVKEHLLPEFVTFVRNYCTQMEHGGIHSKFSLNEFRRMLRPLLDRLQQKQEHSEAEQFATQPDTMPDAPLQIDEAAVKIKTALA